MRLRLILLGLAVLLVTVAWTVSRSRSSDGPQAGLAEETPLTEDPARVDPNGLVAPSTEDSSGREAVREEREPVRDAPLEARPREQVRGTVHDTEGNPLADAEVFFCQGNSWQFYFKDSRARSDADGLFDLRKPQVRVFALLVSAPGYAGRLLGTYSLWRDAVLDVDVELGRGLELGGRVLWPDGAPAVGARVTLHRDLDGALLREPESEKHDTSSGYARYAFTDTDGEGRFLVRGLLEGPVRLRVEAEGADGRIWIAYREPVLAGSTDLEVVIPEPAATEARVVDDRGEPIPRVRFTLTPRISGEGRDRDPEQSQRWLDAADGVFRLEELWPGTWTVHAYAEGHTWIPGEANHLVQVPGAAPTTMRLRRLAGLSGLVRKADGAPAADVPLVLLKDDRKWRDVRTDENGAFALVDLVPGVAKLVAGQGASKASLVVDLRPGEMREGIELGLGSTGCLRVLVQDVDGEPRAGRPVVLLGAGELKREATTGEDGVAVLTGLSPGRLLVLATLEDSLAVKGGSSDASLMRAEAVVRVGETTSVELRAVELVEVRVSGRVLKNGAPLPGARIGFIPDRGMVVEAGDGASTDADGRYRVKLPRPGLYQWFVGRSPKDRSFASGVVEVPARTQLELDISLEARSLSGVVRDASGVGTQAEVRAWAIAGGSMGGLREPTVAAADGEGRFHFDDLNPGRYQVEAVGPAPAGGITAAVVDLSAADVGGLELTLAATATVEIEIGGLSETPSRDERYLIVHAWGAAAHPVARARIRLGRPVVLEGVPAGSVRLAVLHGERAGQGSVELAPGETRSIRIDLEPAGRVRTTLEGEPGDVAGVPAGIIDAHGKDWALAMGVPSLRTALTELSIVGRALSGPLPPGTYTVRVGADAREVHVEAGGLVEVLFSP